ncbi:MAG: PhoH family protein, partial [Cyclobacteriaceae bacterium]
KLVITPLAYIRGRSLSNICFIVDEAQNLTPHEVKTICTNRLRTMYTKTERPSFKRLPSETPFALTCSS